MKKYLSVFEMIARSSIYKVLGCIVVMTVIEFIAFYKEFQELIGFTANGVFLEELIDDDLFQVIFMATYVLITGILVLQGTNMGSVQSYTLQRLRIKEKSVFRLQCIYNMMAYVLLWGAQLVILLLFTGYYVKNQSWIEVSDQTVFLAYYRNYFIHSILPLEDIPGWFTLAFLICGTGIAAAAFTWRQRRGKIGWDLIIFLGVMILSFPRELGSENYFFILVYGILFVLSYIIRKLMNMGEDES